MSGSIGHWIPSQRPLLKLPTSPLFGAGTVQGSHRRWKEASIEMARGSGYVFGLFSGGRGLHLGHLQCG